MIQEIDKVVPQSLRGSATDGRGSERPGPAQFSNSLTKSQLARAQTPELPAFTLADEDMQEFAIS